ncbi:MFS transporter [Streptomyces sannanensis]|uniref:MFS transporter n=1 Tax=Streptomyces sannanensis TaxID=285536 RepID=A0ABP6SIN2_9ACTN
MGGTTPVKTEPVTAPCTPAVEASRTEPGAPSARRVRWVLCALWPTLLLAASAQMIMVTALPRIAAELDGPDRMPWASTVSLLAATAALPVHGRLGDRYGRKGALQFAVVVFVVGSGLAGWSRTMDQLIACRALQGIGVGGILVGVHAITAELVPAHRRRRFMGLAAAAFGAGTVMGPVLGGFVMDRLSWRWCFHLMVPVGLFALIVVAAAPRPSRAAVRGRFDVLGTLLLGAASTCVVLLAAWGGTEHARDSRVVLGLATGAAGAALLLLVVGALVADPVVPSRLFREPVFTAAGLAGAAAGVVLFAAASRLPVHLRAVAGANATESVLLTLPMAGGLVLASVVSVLLIGRTGRHSIPAVLGGVLSAVGLWLLSRSAADTPWLDHSLWTAVLGVGIGLMVPALILAVQDSAVAAGSGAVIGTHICLWQLGGGVGAAVSGVSLAHRIGGAAHVDAVPRPLLHLVPVLLALGLFLAAFFKEKPSVSHQIPAEAGITIPAARTATVYPVGVPLCGTVQHHDGTAVPRAALTLIDVHGRQIGRGASGEDGRYALSVPGSGAYVLIASAGGHQPQAVSVTVGERPVELDVVLGGAGRLAGMVLTADGAPVRDAAVTLTDVRGEVVATTRSGREGAYAITELVAGEYTLAANAHAFRPAALPVSVQAARETRQDIELSGGAVLRGTVRAGAGRPVEEARVTLLNAAGNVVDTLTTETDGTFRFVDLSSGEYTVIAAGYPPTATVLQVAGGGRTERDLQLGHED